MEGSDNPNWDKFFSPVSVYLVQMYVKKKRGNAGYDTTLMPSNDRYPIEEQEN